MYKTKIIAELAWGHDGSLEQAIQLIKAADNSGADILSIHITDLPNYMVKHYGNGSGKVSAGREDEKVYDYLEKINLSNENWIEFKKEVDKTQLSLCVMPNDINSLDFAEDILQPEYYVVPAACFVEQEFLMAVALKKRKTLFRVGGATLGEIEAAMNIFKKCGNSQVILLHGFQNYPTELKETNISQLESLRKIFGCEVGLADHIDGESDLAKVIPILSLAFGATYIEKHLTLDRSRKSEDFESALDPLGFSQMVQYIKAAEVALGSEVFNELSPATIRYREVSRKRIVAKYEIPMGAKITSENICFKRSDIGMQPDKLNTLLGRVVKTTILQDESILLEKLT